MLKRLELLSFGGGVQSTAIIVLIEQGKLPKPDAILWSDTGEESEDVYAHIEALKPRLNAIAPFHVTRKGGKRPRLGMAVIDKALTGKGSNTLPYFLRNPSGGDPQLVQRGCTYNYKTQPLHQMARRLVKAAGGKATKEDPGYRFWLGISRDEMQRMKSDSWHPLIEEFDGRWRKDAVSRLECQTIMAAAGQSAPRSSCVFCPFRTKHEWSILSDNDKARVREIDAALEAGFKEHGKHGTLTDRPYLRPDLRPASDTDWFDGAPEDQMSFGWDNECAGICGV